MIVFWLMVSVLVAGALLLLLPPLLRRGAPAPGVSRKATNVAVYRDQLRELERDLASGVLGREVYEEAKREVERRLLDDVGDVVDDASTESVAGRNAAVVVGAALPIVAFAIYLAVGNFQALLPGAAANAGGQAAHNVSEEQIREMAGRLAARMEKEPENVEGWVMLGRTYTALGQFSDAARAYANAVMRVDADAALLADYADALAMAQGQRLDGEPEKLVLRALKIDPRNIKALALAGSAAFERRDYRSAIDYWERIRAIVPPDSEIGKSIVGSIAEARNLAGQSGGSTPVAGTGATSGGGKPAPGTGRVSGVVEIAPALAAKVAPTDTLFVFARAAQGPRMPLVILRAQAKDLPFRFTLDDSSAMSPGMTLAGQKQVIVGARISKSGSATPQSGDLEGLSSPIDVGTTSVAVVINAETR
ncbi:MAG: c-type cytochrome biogenesis protein CcmI [Betaproteobacteria bacterium]|nr:c-type cytochrome biogenesis protein CcmI [Betaproteobacteria bacterium]